MGVPPIANALRKTAKLRDVEFCLPVPTPTLNILYYLETLRCIASRPASDAPLCLSLPVDQVLL